MASSSSTRRMVEDESGISVFGAPPTQTFGPARPYYSPLHGARPPRHEQAEAAARLGRAAGRPAARAQPRGAARAAAPADRVDHGARGATSRPRTASGVRRRDGGGVDR